MHWLSGLSIRQKVLLIPIAGAIGFFFYLIVSYWTASSNVVLLERARDVQFPVLQSAEKQLVTLGQIRDGLQSAVSAGEEDALTAVKQRANVLQTEIRALAELDRDASSEVQKLNQALTAYLDVAVTLSEQMIKGTADFANLESKAAEMTGSYQRIEQALTSFRDTQQKAFTDSIDSANAAAQRTVVIGIAVGVGTVALLFMIATWLRCLLRPAWHRGPPLPCLPRPCLR